jgi:tyrosine-protein phosphatase SIW14
MKKNLINRLILLVIATSLVTGILWYAYRNTNTGSIVTTTTNPKWAVEVNLPGVPNLHKVSENLYRGAQPTAEGMRQLKRMGINTIVNLRSFNSDRNEINDVNLSYEHIYMKAWHAENEDIVKFLKIAADPNRTPVFVHCQHGADRTGTMCAIYRIAVQGWSKEEAIEEMTKGGFGFHELFANLPAYIRGLDIEKIKQQAGLKPKVVDN